MSKACIKQDLRRGSRAPSRGDIFQVEDESLEKQVGRLF